MRSSGMRYAELPPVDALVAAAHELNASKRLADALRLLDAAEAVQATQGTSPSASLPLYRAAVLADLGRHDAALAAASELADSSNLSLNDTMLRDKIMMRCCMHLRKWRKATEHAEQLLVTENDTLDVESLCVLGRINLVAWNRPEAALTFYRQALERDPLCTVAWDAINEYWLLTPQAQRDLLRSLRFPHFAEPIRSTYAALIAHSPRDTLDSTGEVSVTTPAHLRYYVAARRAYHANAIREALGDVTAALQIKPQDVHCITLKLVLLVDLRATNDLFEYAHRVADSLRPSPAVAAYAVGCYYYSVALFDKAGRYFSKTTQLDPLFAPGWIALGHCYARLEEGELALNAYRRAQNFPGLVIARTLIGLQHMRSNNGTLAGCFLDEGLRFDPDDPLAHNELGVMYLKFHRDIDLAQRHFADAYAALNDPQQPSEYHDCIVFNLATVMRRSGQLTKALELFTTYARLRPYAVAAHTALGLTHHLLGNLRAAIRSYHTALGIKVDTTTRELLEKALEEEMTSMTQDAQYGHVSVDGSDWLDAELAPHAHRGFARPVASSPVAQTPQFSLSAISRIARSESQAPAMGDGPSPTRATINRSLAF